MDTKTLQDCVRVIVSVDDTDYDTTVSLDLSLGCGTEMWDRTSLDLANILRLDARDGGPFAARNVDTLEDETRKFILAMHRQYHALEISKAKLADLHGLQDRAEQSLAMISERFNEETEKRGWCSETDDIIDELNSKLPFGQLEKREREFEVDVTLQHGFFTEHRISVTARSEDEARDSIYDNITDFITEEMVAMSDYYDPIITELYFH